MGASRIPRVDKVTSVLGPRTEDFNRDSGQDYRHHYPRDIEHLAFRSLFRLAERLMLSPVVALPSSLSLPTVRSLAFWLCVVLVSLGSGFEAFAQKTDDDDVIKVTTDLSVYPIRVRKRGNHIPVTVTANSFQLRDPDGVTTSFYFSGGAERVAIVFLLDESGSLSQILSQQRDAAVALFNRFGNSSRVAVIRFSSEPNVIVPFGEDTGATRAAFDFRARRNTPTAIFDAAAAAVQLFESTTRDPAERRIVILISDGLDTASHARPSNIIDEARDRNISFYSIQIPLFEPRDGRLAVRPAAKGFKDLAEKTGGKYFLTRDARTALSPDAIPDLGSVFKSIEDDLKSQYIVGFYVSQKARDGLEHKVSIVLTDNSAEYSIAQFGFSRTHPFSIRLPAAKD
jgi:Ca-activated chloride channel family protein